MCTGSTKQGPSASYTPPLVKQLYDNPNPTFNFGGVDDLGLRIQSEQGREYLSRIERNDANANEIRFREAQLKAIADEQYRRDTPRRLAAERSALAAQQQAEMISYQNRMAEQQAQQKTQTDELRAQQAERVAGIRSRGQAVSQSLQILAQAGGQAPTASTSKPTAGRAGARSTTASLRMGTTGSRAGSGSNLAV
jgi:hypothetical protein